MSLSKESCWWDVGESLSLTSKNWADTELSRCGDRGKQKHRTTPSLKRCWLLRHVKKCWTIKNSCCFELFSVGGREGSERTHSHHTCRVDDLIGPPSDIIITVLTNTLICRPNTQFFISSSSALQTFSLFASFICFSCLTLFSFLLPSSYPYFASTFPLLTQHANNPLPNLHLACIIGWLKHQNLYKCPQEEEGKELEED